MKVVVLRVVPRLFSIVLAAALLAPLAGCGGGSTSLTVTDLPANAVIGAKRAADLVVHVQATSVHKASATLDGRPVDVSAGDRVVTVTATGVSSGKHKLTVHAGGASVSRNFSVDTAPPTLQVQAPATAPSLRTSVTITGSVSDAVRVTADDHNVPVSAGHFLSRCQRLLRGCLWSPSTRPATRRRSWCRSPCITRSCAGCT